MKYSESKQAVNALNEILEFLQQFDTTEQPNNNENYSMAISASDSTYSLMDLGEDSPRDMNDIKCATLLEIRNVFLSSFFISFFILLTL